MESSRGTDAAAVDASGLPSETSWLRVSGQSRGLQEGVECAVDASGLPSDTSRLRVSGQSRGLQGRLHRRARRASGGLYKIFRLGRAQ